MPLRHELPQSFDSNSSSSSAAGSLARARSTTCAYSSTGTSRLFGIVPLCFSWNVFTRRRITAARAWWVEGRWPVTRSYARLSVSVTYMAKLRGATTVKPPSRAQVPFSGPLVVLHQPDEAPEQIVAVARAGRGFRVVLHREHRSVLEREAAVRAVEQRDVRLVDVLRQRVLVDRKAVIHRCDLDLAGGQVLHRMVRAVMALMHLHGLAAEGEAEHLVAEADAEGRRARIDDLLDDRHRIFAGRRRIARAVRQ